MKTAPFLTVIIPMYNEEIGADRCVRGMLKVTEKFGGDVGLMIVNDGSKDRTLTILRGLQQEGFKFDILDQQPNGGYGKACLSGMHAADAAGSQFGLVMDSDLTNDPQLIKFFYDKLQSGHFDFMKASRYRAGGGMNGVPWQRQLPTILGNLVARSCFRMGIWDCTNGFRAVRLGLVRDLVLHERGFPSIVEELYHLKRQGAVGGEIPYTLTKRSEGDQHSKFSYKPNVFWRYLKYCLKASVIGRASRPEWVR